MNIKRFFHDYIELVPLVILPLILIFALCMALRSRSHRVQCESNGEVVFEGEVENFHASNNYVRLRTRDGQVITLAGQALYCHAVEIED